MGLAADRDNYRGYDVSCYAYSFIEFVWGMGWWVVLNNIITTATCHINSGTTLPVSCSTHGLSDMRDPLLFLDA